MSLFHLSLIIFVNLNKIAHAVPFFDYGSGLTEDRPILTWIKSLDMIKLGGRSEFLGEYGGTFDLLSTYGCNCHAIISGKTATGI